MARIRREKMGSVDFSCLAPFRDIFLEGREGVHSLRNGILPLYVLCDRSAGWREGELLSYEARRVSGIKQDGRIPPSVHADKFNVTSRGLLSLSRSGQGCSSASPSIPSRRIDDRGKIRLKVQANPFILPGEKRPGVSLSHAYISGEV